MATKWGEKLREKFWEKNEIRVVASGASSATWRHAFFEGMTIGL